MKIFRNKAFWSFFSKYGFELKSNLNRILKPRISSKMESNVFQKALMEFWFRIWIEYGFEQKQKLSTRTKNIKQYISTKTNA
jgi:hypothetical protein